MATIAAETFSVLAWYSSYSLSSSLYPSQSLVPVHGALSGLAVAAISLPLRTRQFPELLADLKASKPSLVRSTLRLMGGHGVFWCIYTPLASQVLKKDTLEFEDYRQLFWAGVDCGIAAGGSLGYRLVSILSFTGPVTNPVFGMAGYRIVLTSCLGMGAIVAALEGAVCSPALKSLKSRLHSI